ncbi:hypothetical protein ILUMI_04764 [Ignelater luminosus]|uniref:Uncharacterized protein n=1 Tax=Ignelater luminosus TaxID=2038154 RepID=A0A8K0GIR1_IGNLU|nr:hypothetical protein ILUMI_04764 [Ignelater luminosus]
MKMLEDSTRERIEQYKQIQNSTQSKIRNKKREAQKAKLEEMEKHHRNRNAKLFYKNLKEKKKGFQPQTVVLKNHQGEICVDTTSMLNIRENVFRNTLTNNECETENKQLHQNNQDKQKLEEPTKKEIIEIIKKSKNNKSPGEDGITTEQIKYSSEEIFDRIYNLIKQTWKEKCMPKEWSQALVHLVHKKGSTQNPENYSHIIRMDNNELTRTIFKTEMAEKNRKGRPRRTWWQNVEEDIKKFNLHDWENIATNRKMWKLRIEAIGLQG